MRSTKIYSLLDADIPVDKNPTDHQEILSDYNNAWDVYISIPCLDRLIYDEGMDVIYTFL